MGDVKKVVILGGGVGAMTAAWELSEANQNPDPNATKYDITVYQLGWRLGGKGASGRNMDDGYGHRIQEHGLHIWMGFYANAFRMIRKVYTDLDRPEGHPLRTWTDAFKAQNDITAEANTLLGWYPWIMPFPTNDRLPGDRPKFIPIIGILKMIAEKLKSIIDNMLGEVANIAAHPVDTAIDAVLLGDVIAALRDELEKVRQEAVVAEETGDHEKVHEHAVHAHRLLDELFLSLKPIDSIVHYLYAIDIGLAIIRGIIKERIWLTEDWQKIDNKEWREWLLEHGMHDATRWCPYIRLVYNLVFGYRDGHPDPEHADLCAGWTTKGVIRMCLEYDGAIYWKMQAGMGDTIFWPLYEVLRRRGVKFRYFHRVREVVPTDDGQQIEEIRIGVQATLKEGIDEYDPKVMVNGLECWPAVPNYDQLAQGELLKAGNIDLEDYNAPWPDLAEIRLRQGQDFDWCVFGLSLGAVPKVCPRLVEQKQEWRDMVEKVLTVRTQATQLWLNQDIKELGWPPAVNGDTTERAVFGAFVEPLDTWADMSQLLPCEDWPAADNVQNIAYFCGPATEDTNPYQTALDMVRFDYHWIWPNAYDEVGRFKWEWLVDPEQRAGQARFAGQFFRINVQPTELYVLSVKGSTKYRLTEDTKYKNLCVVGDWNRNPMPLGCVEGAVMGGMMGIKPILPKLHIVD